MRQQWDITPEDFDKFLTWLDPDHEQAANKYESIRKKLDRFFLCRGWGVDAEELVDDTISRVIKKMRTLADSYVGERIAYFLAVAHNVQHEYLERRRRQAPPPVSPPVPDSPEEKERLDRCLQRCLKGLTEENRNLILKYYTGDKHEKIVHRKELADKLGIAPNALRIRAHRIRTDLRHCVERCV